MNLDKYRKARLVRPTEWIDVDELQGFLFDDGEKPVLLARGLDANELYHVRQEIKDVPVGEAFVDALQKAYDGDVKPLGDEIAKILNKPIDKRVLPQTAYRVALILRGTISEDGKPIFNRQDVVKLYEHFPTTFARLADLIDTLSGQASRLGGLSNGTGEMTVSAPQ